MNVIEWVISILAVCIIILVLGIILGIWDAISKNKNKDTNTK